MIVDLSPSVKKFHHNKRHPCPICNGERCTVKENGLLLCLRAEGFKGEVVNGWRCISPRKTLTSTWVVDDGNNIFNNNKYQRQEQRQEPKSLSYSPSERDEWNRKIIEDLSLDEKHKEALLKRGLTSEQMLFRTVEAGQKLSFELPDHFSAGKGSQLVTGGRGILIPVINYHNQITAFQVRLDQSQAGRYRWLSHPGAQLSLDGELPMAFYHQGDYKEINVTESPLKSYIAHCRHGFSATAGMVGACPRQVLAECERKKITRVIVNPDAGDVVNPQVLAKWKNFAGDLRKAGIQVLFRWWGQLTKEHDDVDEITSLEEAKLLSPEEFLELGGVKEEIAPPEEKFTPNRKIQTLDLPQEGSCHLKAPMGSGKTELILTKILDWEKQGKRVILLSHRNNLLRQTIARAAKKGVVIYHLHDDQAFNQLVDPYCHIALCIDSLFHLVKFITEDTIILIDEIRGVMDHVNSSKYSFAMVSSLKKALTQCGLFVSLDANHNDRLCSLLDSLSGKTGEKWELNATPQSFPVSVVKGEKLLIESLDKGEKLLVATDSRKRAEKLDLLARNRNLKTLLISSLTSSLDEVKFFMSDPDQAILHHQYDVVICTPTVESGLSIQVPYFDKIYGFFVGAIAVPQILQMLCRYRIWSVPRLINCKPVGVKSHRFVDSYNEFLTIRKEQEKILRNHITQEEAIQKILSNQISAYTKFYEESCYLEIMQSNQLQRSLIEFLSSQGFEISVEEEGEKSPEFKLAEEEWKQIEAANFKAAIPYDSIEEAEVVARAGASKEQSFRVARTFFDHKYPELINNCTEAEVQALQENEKLLRGISRREELLENTQVEVFLAEEDLEKSSKEDLNKAKKEEVKKAIASELFPELMAISKLEEYSESTEEITNLIQKVSKNPLWVTVLNFGKLHEGKAYKHIKGRARHVSPVALVADLLELVGFTTETVRRGTGENGKRIRYYRAASFCETLETKIVESVRKRLDRRASQPLSTPPEILEKSQKKEVWTAEKLPVKPVEKLVEKLPVKPTLPTQEEVDWNEVVRDCHQFWANFSFY